MHDAVTDSPQFATVLRQEVERALKEKGMSARQASIDAIGNDGLIRDIRAGRSISAERLSALAAVLGLELYLGPPRPEAPTADAGTFALIPLHEAELSAGDGAEGSDAVEGMVAFRRDWLARLGVIERHARLARIRGDSMEPLLRGGDMVLIDTSRTTVPVRSPAGLARIRRNPELALYALRRGSDISVKRVERSDWNGLLLVSENWRQYPPEPVPEADLGGGGTTAILGQVRWWAHSVAR